MERKEAIRSAYRLTGSSDFYDGMITCSTLSGKYEKTGFFTPPYETAFSLKKRLEKLYATVTLGTVKGMAWFVCRKGLR